MNTPKIAIAVMSIVFAACAADAADDAIEVARANVDAPADEADDAVGSTTVSLLEDACDTHWLELVDGDRVSHPVSIYAVRTTSVRLAWACDEAPSANGRPAECVGVLPWLTSAGEIVVPCEDDDGRIYQRTRLVIERPITP